MRTSTLTPLQKHNFHHLYWDVFWWGALAGSTLAFLPVFLARLNATSFEVGLLTAGPAVVSIIISMLAGRLMRGRDILRVTRVTSILHRLGYVLLVPLPWLLGAREQVWAALGLTLLFSFPGTVISISFNAMFADLVAAEWRPHVVGRRNALLSLSMTFGTLGCGWLLDALVFPLNYQLVFAIGVFGAALSSYHLWRLMPVNEVPLRLGKPMRDFARQGWVMVGDAVRSPTGLRYLLRQSGKTMLPLELLRTPFGPFIFSYFIFYMFQYVSVPIFPLYYVQTLDLTDGVISLGYAVFHVAMMASSMALGWVNQRMNSHRVLTVSALLYCVYPLFMGLANGPGMVILASVLGGLVWGIGNGQMVSVLMDRTPEDERPAYMALHNLILNVGILGGSFIGPFVGLFLGLRGAVLAGAALRLAAGVVMGALARPRAAE
ncbi:MAG: MFS transporter [Anaerolineae bacterium]|nr:MAG: MFS transporter [Anaerolineae bacterium]